MQQAHELKYKLLIKESILRHTLPRETIIGLGHETKHSNCLAGLSGVSNWCIHAVCPLRCIIAWVPICLHRDTDTAVCQWQCRCQVGTLVTSTKYHSTDAVLQHDTSRCRAVKGACRCTIAHKGQTMAAFVSVHLSQLEGEQLHTWLLV